MISSSGERRNQKPQGRTAGRRQAKKRRYYSDRQNFQKLDQGLIRVDIDQP
jgi:hypothetical protein